MLNRDQFSIEDRDLHDPHKYKPRPHIPIGETQGKLFNEYRYPHGYGPARQARVEDALYEIGGIERPQQEPYLPHFDEGHREDQPAREIFHGLAASTVPAEHITSLAHLRQFDLSNAMGEGATVLGAYAHPQQDVYINPEHHDLRSYVGTAAESMQHTVAHEIGHHIGYATHEDEPYVMSAVREAHADIYAQRHTPQIRNVTGHQNTALSIEAGALGRNFIRHAQSQYVEELMKHGVEPHSSFAQTVEETKARQAFHTQSPDQGTLF